MAELKRALVVDDSKSARLVLRRMLEKHSLLVDTVESGKLALDFLNYNRPDIIFMDHMMPGLDGFETIKAIKQNPGIADIPVMMYTSKGGDLYQEQAAEIGAAGVLPKTVAPSELYQALLKIGLVNERRKKQRSPDDENPSERAEDILQARVATTPPPPPQTGKDELPRDNARNHSLDEQLRSLLDEQRAEIRKDVLLSMETVARQTSAKLHKELDEKLDTLKPVTVENPAAIQWPTLLLILLLFLSLAWNYRLTQKDVPPAFVAQAPARVEGTATSTTSSPDTRLAELQARQADTEARLRVSWDTAAWALNQELAFGYDEIALDGERAEIIETLLSRLNGSGYRGSVGVQTHVGEFCLLGDQEKGFRLPPPELPLDKCDFIGNPAQASDTPSAHQSLSFANFLSSTPLLGRNGIELDIVALPRGQALTTYPDRETATAGTWNQAAAANNRIIIQLEP